MKHCEQLKILILKNLLLRRRTLCYTLTEALVPVLYTFFFCLMRLYIPNQFEGTQVEGTTNISIMSDNYTVIGYAPRSPAIDDLMSAVERKIYRQPWFNNSTTLQILGFKSEFSMMRFAQRNPNFLAYAYAFGNVTFMTEVLPENLRIILRLKSNSTTYYHRGEFYNEAIMLQIIMEAFVDNCSGQERNYSVDYEIISPTLEPRRDSFLVQDMYRIALIIVGLTAYLVWRNVYLIATERECSILMLLTHMGVNPLVYWLSWFITTLVIIELVCMFFAGMLFVPIFNKEPILKGSDTSLIVTYFSMLGFTLSAYCVLGSVIFKDAETCSAVASILYVLVTFPAIEASQSSRANRIASLFFVSVNIISAFTHIGQLEHQGPGYGWQRLATLKYPEYLASSLGFCGFLYLFLAWILYSIVICGSPPWINIQLLNTCSEQPTHTKIQRDGKTYSKIGIRVEKLCVTNFRKIIDVTMIMLEDTITVITGHELSGKATFMSVLKGNVRPSSGTVTIYGLDIVQNTLAVKLITGLCPREQTAIFSELTVGENMKFFATMKHLCQDKEMSDIGKLAQEFDLLSSINATVKHLCASDKRLLQVALAFIGHNKVILLEDPSLNMDIPTKYRLWCTIREKAFNKTVVLNTNIADEAEMAGDRIAIFLKGELKCCGTLHYINLFLGAGYHLVIEKEDKCREDLIEYVVYNMIRNSVQTENLDHAMIFWLPMKTTEAFHNLFSLLHTHKQKLGVANFTVDATTLKDAIINLSEYDFMRKDPIKVPQVDYSLIPSSSDSSICNSRIRDKLNTILNDIRLSTSVGSSRKPFKPSVRIKEMNFDQIIKESFSTDSFLVHAILKSMSKSKYQEGRLRWSQAGALLKKKLILSTCSLHIEMFQVAILLLLSYWMSKPSNEMFCYMNECDQTPIFNSVLNTAVLCTQGPHRNNASKMLLDKYKSIFKDSDLLAWDYDESRANMTTVATILKTVNMRATIGVRFNVTDFSDDLQATAYYLPNDVDVGTSILRSLTAVMNAFLKYVTDSDRFSVYASTHHQMVNSIITKDVSRDQTEKTAHRFSHHASVLNAVALLLVPYFVVLERKTGSKDVQLLSGATPFVYWSTTFLFDFLMYNFLCNTYSLSAARQNKPEGLDLKYQLSLLYFFNGIMMILYVYVMQSFFNSPSTAVGFMMIFNYCLGNPSSTFLKFTHDNIGISVKDYLTLIFLMAPPHILPQAVYHLVLYSRAAYFCSLYRPLCSDPQNSNYREDCCLDICQKKGTCLEETHESFSFYLREVPIQLATMIAHIVIWGSLLVLLEYKSSCKICRKPSDSSNRKNTIRMSSVVKKFTQSNDSPKKPINTRGASFAIPDRTLTSSKEDSILCGVEDGITLSNVEKKIGKDLVISGISLVINNGDLFCLAGADIVEPSTVVEMICGLDTPTSGSIFVHGKGFNSFGRPQVPHIGYCSNHTNGLLPTMTGRETLWMFAKLRGVADWNIKRLVEIYLNAFLLDSVANNHSSNYSDCEVRRLSIAAALIGEPDICLLCNPLYKLDSESKEAVWRWLRRLRNLKKTIVFASDNLQEIGNNAACIMILVDGRPVCIGTAESIEEMYCTGYTLLAKLDPRNPPGSLELFSSTLKEKLPDCQMFHGDENLLHFHIPYETNYLADVFATVENIKKLIKIESYRLNRTNLDQILTAAQDAYFVHTVTSHMQGEGDQISACT